MKVHSLLKSLNAIDEEMIAEADRFAVKRREQLKSRQHIFVTEVTAVAAIAIAVAGVFSSRCSQVTHHKSSQVKMEFCWMIRRQKQLQKQMKR